MNNTIAGKLRKYELKLKNASELNKKQIYEIGNKINKILEPEFVIPPTGVITRTPVGEGMYVHKDRGEEGYEDVINDFGTCTCIDYGVVVYFGSWEGGEIYYPNKNISLKPVPGRLICHMADYGYEHLVQNVKNLLRNRLKPLH